MCKHKHSLAETVEKGVLAFLSYHDKFVLQQITLVS